MMMGREIFDKCTETKELPDGQTEIKCKLGLWAVSGASKDKVQFEAWRYWRQYYSGGEYKKLLSPNKRLASGGRHEDTSRGMQDERAYLNRGRI